MSGNTPFAAVDSDVSPALLPLASQQAVAVSTTVASSTVDRGTTFPSAPNDKDEYHYVADATNGIVWRFKYNAGSASTYKWEFIGGPPLYAEVVTQETTASATYAALATVGPSITVPRAGDYDVLIGCAGFGSASASTLFMSYDIGGTGAVDADGEWIADATGVAGSASSGTRPRRKSALAASTALVSKYKVSAGTANFLRRWMYVYPVRVI